VVRLKISKNIIICKLYGNAEKLNTTRRQNLSFTQKMYELQQLLICNNNKSLKGILSKSEVVNIAMRLSLNYLKDPIYSDHSLSTSIET
jgi:hypothetical protein